MTSPRIVEHHVRGLRDIRAIMNSMKTLAYLETQKLSRIVPAQRAVTRQLDIAALDLLAHYPHILPSGIPPKHLWRLPMKPCRYSAATDIPRCFR